MSSDALNPVSSRRRLLGASAVAAAALASGAAPAAAQGAANSLEAVRASGRVRMGVTPAEPWAFKDPVDNQWRGFSVSFGNAIAEALGVKLEIEEVTLATAIAALQSDKVDFVPVLDGTPQRALAADFTPTPLVWHAQAVLVADDMAVKTWADLDKAGVTIAVPQGSVMETYAKRMAPKAQVLSFPNNPETVAAFQSGRANAASLFGPALSVLQARLKRGKIVIPTPARIAVSQVAVRRTPEKSFRDWLDLSVAYYYNTGQTQTWYEEYLEYRKIDPKTVPAVRRELWPAA